MSAEATKSIRLKRNEIKLTPKDIERFWKKVDKNGPLPDQSNPHYAGLGNCWEWRGYVTIYGYGQFPINSYPYKAHRVAYVAHFGKEPENENICHKCDNRKCVRIDHFFVGSQKENQEDMVKKCRQNSPTGERHSSRTKPERVPRGKKHWNSKLTDEKVRLIRSLISQGVNQRFIAKQIGISTSVVSQIRHKQTWAHVD